MLLTGDQQLRRRASSLGVRVHGILWLCDQIEGAGAMVLHDLVDALEQLMANPLVFLPADELDARLTRLRARSRGRP